MERRAAKRYLRRLRVALTELGAGARIEGFTGNISTSGVFVSCGRMIHVGERVQLELSTGERPLILYGVIVRQVRVPPALRSVQREGMGIRFLRVSTLVQEILPPSSEEDEGQPHQAEEPTVLAERTPAKKASAPRGQKRASPISRTETDNAPARKAAPPKATPANPRHADPPGVFRVQLVDRTELRKRYEEEIRFGGMSVSTDRAPSLGDHVTVLLELATSKTEPLAVKAEVVLVHDDGSFGVQFTDPSRFLFAVKRLF